MFPHFNVVVQAQLLQQVILEMIPVLQFVLEEGNRMEKDHSGHLLVVPVVNVSTNLSTKDPWAKSTEC